ncbi:MAG: DNA repair protein RadC [Candidatus Euphemobacter frigidus]|nr:DNA repair protein RadC [Candidatus Euphemobacter frigidus]MDP8275942.1 DNA repair protein RadC [Candidatus Euphemobacter frigidus]
MTIKKRDDSAGHRKRLRERFRRSGLRGFHDYEVVELLLTLGAPQGDCKPQAKAAIKKFGSLKGVLDATSEQLQEIKGLGPKNIFGLELVREMASIYLKEKAREKPLAGSPRAVFDFLRQSLGGLPKEVFQVVYVNNTNKIIEAEQLFQGTVDQSAIHPREVIAGALKNHATRLIFAHNHPGGSLRPSSEDIEITSRLKKACNAVGIEVLDHIIVTTDGYFSMREHGLI